MIIKEIDKKALNNPFERAGTKAEDEMAFYLKREFGDDKETLVIHDLRLLAHPEPSLVEMFDRRRRDGLADNPGHRLQPLGRGGNHRGGGGFRDLHPEEIAHGLRQPLLGDQLADGKIGRHGRSVGAVLRRRRDPLREFALRHRPAMPAAAPVGAMFGDGRRHARDVEHLARHVIDGIARIERSAALPAPRREMVDHRIGIFGLAQGMPWMSHLAAGPAISLLARRHPPRFLAEPIARRRLAAVRTIEAQTTLEFRQPGFQRRYFRL